MFDELPTTPANQRMRYLKLKQIHAKRKFGHAGIKWSR